MTGIAARSLRGPGADSALPASKLSFPAHTDLPAGDWFLDDLRTEAYWENLRGERTPRELAQILGKARNAIDHLILALEVDRLTHVGWMRLAFELKPVALATRITQSIAEREAARKLSKSKPRVAIGHRRAAAKEARPQRRSRDPIP